MKIEKDLPAPLTPTPWMAPEGMTGYRWVILGLVFTAWITSFLDRLAWSNVGVSASEDMHLPLSSLGIFVTAFFIGYSASNFVMGFVTDRIGSRAALLFALCPLGVFTAGFGMVHSMQAGLVLQVLMGLAAGVDNAACSKLVAIWFRKRHLGLAMSLLATAPSLGIGLTNAVYPAMLAFIDWRTLYYGLGLWTLLVAIVAFTFIRNTPPDVKESETRGTATLGSLVRNRTVMLIAGAGFGAIWATWGFAFWANALMMKGRGLSSGEASLVMVAFSCGAVISKPFIGWLSDKLGGRRKPFIAVCIGLLAVLLLVFGQAQTKSEFLVLAPFLGAAAFNYAPLMCALIAEVVGVENTAAAIGVMNGFWQVGSVVAPSAVALVYGATNSFTSAFATLAVGPLLGFVLTLFVSEKRKDK